MSSTVRTPRSLLHLFPALIRQLEHRCWVFMLFLSLLPVAVLPNSAYAQNFFPLANVRPGLHGTGRTVFAGNKIEEFQVEILGLLRNVSPKQTIILARLSGGPLAETGVMQGMSGSPVYIDGKLLGAVALGFPFSKEPIAGIEPIQSMITDSSPQNPVAANNTPPEIAAAANFRTYSHLVTSRRSPESPRSDFPDISTETPYASPFGNLRALATPLSLSGFTPATLQTFTTEFRRLGFEPLQGLSSGSAASPSQQTPNPSPSVTPLLPGSMISVGLLTGDMNITADGTATLVDGKRIYAFGHRFLDTGSTELPFARSEVVALIPTLNSSFKLSTPLEWIGTILSDRASAISGEIGRSAHTVPLSVAVQSSATGSHDYHFQVVNDRFLTPFITQTALFSVLDATERTLGVGTLSLEGRVEWQENLPPLVIRDTFVSDSGLVQQVSTDAVVPLGFVLGAGFRGIHMKNITFTLHTSESKRQLHIAQAWTSSHDVRPGDTLQITTLLQGENGFELTRSASYQVPLGAPLGALNFTISDANTLNFPDFSGLSQSALHSPASLIQTINSFRDNDAFYVRVWRQEPAFTISGSGPDGDLSDPPPSVALVLSDPSNSTTSSAALALTRGSQIAELPVATTGYVVTGAKTLQVDVKE